VFDTVFDAAEKTGIDKAILSATPTDKKGFIGPIASIATASRTDEAAARRSLHCGSLDAGSYAFGQGMTALVLSIGCYCPWLTIIVRHAGVSFGRFSLRQARMVKSP
jgi:hypothetical protein